MQEQQLRDSTTSLLDLQTSLQKASVDAQALINQTMVLRIGLLTVGIIAIGETGYIAGHVIGWW
jgi:hypothetical protein